MRIRSRQPADSTRIALLLMACAALLATTSGLLLALHLLGTEHAGHHDSHDCAICQQFLAIAKKALPAPAAEWVQPAPVFCTDAPDFVEHVKHRYPEVSRPRGPPCSCLHQSV